MLSSPVSASHARKPHRTTIRKSDRPNVSNVQCYPSPVCRSQVFQVHLYLAATDTNDTLISLMGKTKRTSVAPSRDERAHRMPAVTASLPKGRCNSPAHCRTPKMRDFPRRQTTRRAAKGITRDAPGLVSRCVRTSGRRTYSPRCGGSSRAKMPTRSRRGISSCE